MGKTYRFNPAKVKLARGEYKKEVERALRGKVNKRKKISKQEKYKEVNYEVE